MILALLVAIPLGNAQKREELNSAAMSRAMESITAGDASEALKQLNVEVGNHPKNGYAYAWMGYIYYSQEENGYALQSLEKAIKYLPSRDKEYLSFAYKCRADLYFKNLEEYDKALDDYDKAISYDSKNIQNYIDRAEFYYQRKKYELADKDYRKIISLDPSNVMGYMGLGRNEIERKNYAQAIEQFNYVIKLHQSNYSTVYSFRAECYIATGRFSEAADDIVTALAIDSDDKAWGLMNVLADSSYLSMTSRLKVEKNRNPNNGFWPYAIGVVNETARKYTKAIASYKESYSTDANVVLLSRIASCLQEMGDCGHALEYINRAIDEDTSEISYRMQRAGINYDLGDIDKTVSEIEYCMSLYPNYYGFYNQRAWFYSLMGKDEEALEDYTTAITLEPKVSGLYMHRGRIMLRLGDDKAAKKDFQKALELDTVMSEMSDAYYANFYLGNKAEAIRLLDTALKYNDNQHGYYEAACVYSLMNEKEKALSYFKKALEGGCRQFEHISRDRDLDNIRDMEEFKNLVSQHKEKQKQVDAANAEILGQAVEHKVEIPFERKNGVTEVQCKINDLPLSFIFDTGAGDVTISMVEASFMLKNGYLTSKDMLGRQNYMTASGEITEGTVINLNTIEIGGLKLNNVRASVVKSQKAPLLLGQSVLSRLGKIEIDNAAKVLKITYTEIK